MKRNTKSIQEAEITICQLRRIGHALDRVRGILIYLESQNLSPGLYARILTIL